MKPETTEVFPRNDDALTAMPDSAGTRSVSWDSFER